MIHRVYDYVHWKIKLKVKKNIFIEDLLYNVDDLDEAFSVLDTHYGDIRTVLPRLRVKLDKPPRHPEREEDKTKNIQHILNYWKTGRNHG